MVTSSLKLSTSTGIFLIDTSTIVRIEASSNYSKLYFSNGKVLVTAKLLKWFEEKLPHQSFIRLHRSHLVNNLFMNTLQRNFKEIELTNGNFIQVSKRRRKSVVMKFLAFLMMLFVFHSNLFAQNVGIGINTPAAKLHIKGSADTSQFFIDANSTQSSNQPLIKLRNSSGNDLLWIHSDNSSNSFLGLNAGRINNAAGGALNNTFIGSSSGYSNTAGNNNTATGLGTLYSNNAGIGNTANGVNALTLNTTGDWNTANGFQALAFNNTGSNNTAHGYFSLYSNVAGNNATAFGYQAMRYANNTASPFTNYNVAIGYEALRGSTTAANNTGNSNTAIGYQSMLNNSNGFSNTAYGRNTLLSNTGGDNNTAIGYQSMNDNTTGLNNTATGFQSLNNNVDGDRNTAYGTSALLSNIGGNNGTAFGYGAMLLLNNQAASYTNDNVAVGYEALRGSVSASNNTGLGNSALGYQALYSNSTGSRNTANGYNSLYLNSTADSNTAIGYSSLRNNSTGSSNTAIGSFALNDNTTGTNNTAIGSTSLPSNTTGSNNTVIGVNALSQTVAGSNATVIGYNAMGNYNNTATAFPNFNVAVGYEALFGKPNNVASLNTGNNNTAIGYQSLYENSGGDYNTAAGFNALYNNINGNQNTAVGMYSLYLHQGGDGVTAVGYSAGSAYVNDNGCTFIGRNSETSSFLLTNATAIGYNAIVNGNNKVIIGNTSVGSIGGQVGWTTFSDGRFKVKVTEDIYGLDFILKLRPVSYNTDIASLNTFIGTDKIRQIKESRGEKIPQYDVGNSPSIRHTGFIAQEVEKSAKELGFDFSGVDAPKNANDIYGIRYAEFVVPLVKAVQELNKKTDDQLKMIAELKKEIELLKLKK